MSAAVVEIKLHQEQRSPRAVRIPEQLTAADVDDVLYEFGFEWFGEDYGTQRLVALDDDCIDDYDDAADVMREANAHLALYDRTEHRWVPLRAGDWVVEPCDGYDGFVRMSPEDFAVKYEVVVR